eukprot:568339-Prorocentrum_minimum.AAC.1
MHAAKDKNNSTDLTCLLHSQSGQTPLLVAIYHNHVDVVDILLGFPAIEPNWASPAKRVDEGSPTNQATMVNEPDKKGRTMLWRAARRGHTESVAALLAVDTIDPNKSDKGRLNLMAAIGQWMRTLRLSVSLLGVFIFWGFGPVARLHLSSALTTIITNPSLMIHTTQDMWTPLSDAAFNGHTGVVRMLLLNSVVDLSLTNKVNPPLSP